jgi:hypothetical protein
MNPKNYTLAKQMGRARRADSSRIPIIEKHFHQSRGVALPGSAPASGLKKSLQRVHFASSFPCLFYVSIVFQQFGEPALRYSGCSGLLSTAAISPWLVDEEVELVWTHKDTCSGLRFSIA